MDMLSFILNSAKLSVRVTHLIKQTNTSLSTKYSAELQIPATVCGAGGGKRLWSTGGYSIQFCITP